MDNNTPAPPPGVPPANPPVPPLTPPQSVPGEQITELKNPAVAPTTPPEPVHKKVSRKLVTIVLIAASIFIAFYAGIYIFLNDQLNKVTHTGQVVPTLPATPTPTDPTAGWKTYTNSDLGFSLKIPPDWEVKDESATAKRILFIPKKAKVPAGVSATNPDYGYAFSVEVDKGNAKTPQEYWQERVKAGARSPASEAITVGGVSGIKTSNNAMDSHDTRMFFSKDNSLYTLREDYFIADADEGKELYPNAEKEFALILSTVTFGGPTQTDISTNMKQFDSPKGKFTISYPASWYITEYNDQNNCIDISDIKTPRDIPAKIEPAGHSIIALCIYKGSMPMNFARTEGGDATQKNPTIQPVTINGYTGVRGLSSSTLGDSDLIYLKGPDNTYAGIVFELGDTNAFNQILSTFRFTN